jgi:hypothetical protein
MTQPTGLRVHVDGDLPPETLEQIRAAVSDTVRAQVAKLDLLRDFREEELPGIRPGHQTMGLVYIPVEEPSEPKPHTGRR